MMTFLAESEDTNGSFVLCEYYAKAGNEPPPHVHEREDEHYYVLEGEIDAFVGDEVFRLKTGESLFLPKGKPHTLIIRSPQFRSFFLFLPGGVEKYIRWSEFLTAVRTNQAQAARALGAPIFDYYTDHPDEAAIFRATMQSVSEGVASEIARMLDTSTYSVAVDVGGADGALVLTLSLMGAATFCMGLLPTFFQVGVAAPV